MTAVDVGGDGVRSGGGGVGEGEGVDEVLGFSSPKMASSPSSSLKISSSISFRVAGSLLGRVCLLLLTIEVSLSCMSFLFCGTTIFDEVGLSLAFSSCVKSIKLSSKVSVFSVMSFLFVDV